MGYHIIKTFEVRWRVRISESKKPAIRLVSLNSGARTRTNAAGV